LRGYQVYLPDFPLYEAKPGGFFDVRDFIRPQDVSGISSTLWREAGGDEGRFVELATSWVHNSIHYKSERDEFWKTPSQTVSEGAGDCEDFAILLQSLVEPYVPDFKVALGEYDGVPHAFNLWDDHLVDAVAGEILPLNAEGYDISYWFTSEEYGRFYQRKRLLYTLG